MPRTNLEPFAMVPRDLIAAVPPRALQVWCCLAQWTDAGERTTHPTIGRIAGELDVSRRAVEMALTALEKTGRLVRTSGKHAGRGNEYVLVLTRKHGAQNPPHWYEKNCAPNYNKVVNTKNPLTNTPLPPASRGGARIAGGAEIYAQWAEWWALYPRREGHGRALAIWKRLAPEDRAAAMDGARALAAVYAAAPDQRRRYCLAPARWLAEARWKDDHEAIETYFHAPGAVTAGARRAAAKARAAQLQQELEARDRARRAEQAEHDRRRRAATGGH